MLNRINKFQLENSMNIVKSDQNYDEPWHIDQRT